MPHISQQIVYSLAEVFRFDAELLYIPVDSLVADEVYFVERVEGLNKISGYSCNAPRGKVHVTALRRLFSVFKCELSIPDKSIDDAAFQRLRISTSSSRSPHRGQAKFDTA